MRLQLNTVGWKPHAPAIHSEIGGKVALQIKIVYNPRVLRSTARAALRLSAAVTLGERASEPA